MQGKIVKGISGFYYVHIAESGIYECKAKGIFRNQNIKPLVGDDVTIVILDEEKKKGNIEAILPRKNELIRPAVANIDLALVIFAAAKPQPNFNLLDRFLIMMEYQKVPVVICFNKQDLVSEEELEQIAKVYQNCGYTVLYTSASEQCGVEELKQLLKNKTTAVAGPSGVGKGTIVKTLVKRREDVVESVSCTTRAPREGEKHGREYFFLTKEEFEKRIEENDFLEYDEHFGNFYGTPKSFVKETLKTKSVILEIDVVGGLNAKKEIPQTVLVMIAPPSIEELKRRLIGRGTESKEEIENRLARLEYELSQKDKYDYVIVNDDLETAIRDLESIIDGKQSLK